MPAKLTTEIFIQKAQEIHGDLYDYSQTVYVNGATKVKINCHTHGEFEQRSDSHLSARGCPVCAYESKSKTQSAKARSEFVQKSQEIHNNKYAYELVDYVNAHIKVEITCPIHGSWGQTPRNHLSGRGCPHCANEASGYTRTKFKDKCIKNNNGLGILYILGCFNTDKTEVFIKIGITSNSIKKRYCNKASMPYNYKVLHEIVGDPEYIYNLETLLHKKSRNYRYTPAIPFGGSSSECFIDNKSYLSKLNTYMSEWNPF